MRSLDTTVTYKTYLEHPLSERNADSLMQFTDSEYWAPAPSSSTPDKQIYLSSNGRLVAQGLSTKGLLTITTRPFDPAP